MMRSAVLTQSMHVTDGWTEGIGVAYTRYSIYAVARKNHIIYYLWFLSDQPNVPELIYISPGPKDRTFTKPTHIVAFFTGQVPFMLPNQQYSRNNCKKHDDRITVAVFNFIFEHQ